MRHFGGGKTQLPLLFALKMTTHIKILYSANSADFGANLAATCLNDKNQTDCATEKHRYNVNCYLMSAHKHNIAAVRKLDRA